jgi:tetraacyldisaccharide 4'-kinase
VLKKKLENWVVRAWYEGHPILSLLLPLSALFSFVTSRRRLAFQTGEKIAWRAPVPLVIVGNITVGGTGKTPVVIHLVEALQQRGFKPGVISRGFGGQSEHYPMAVQPGSDPDVVGDEPHLIVNRTKVPMVVDPNRVRAARYLLDNYDCNLILSDDGLQHYALQRDIEIVVVDSTRGLGNALLLPAGPLREPPSRLKQADYVLVNGEDSIELPVPYTRMHYQSVGFFDVARFHEVSMEAMLSAVDMRAPVHAVAGIGNPQRFFDTLKTLGFSVNAHSFEDHHHYRETDFSFDDGRQLVLMTEKDAVKCRRFARKNWYYLRISASLKTAVLERLVQHITAQMDILNQQDDVTIHQHRLPE